MIELTDKQKEFIWLAHGKAMTFKEIAKVLNEEYTTISKWEIELREYWLPVAQMRSIYNQKKIQIISIEQFRDWYDKSAKNAKCGYCGVTEEELNRLNQQEPLTKRHRGEKLELDRKQPNEPYDNLDNLIMACYWCNQAKTDTFTHEEFEKVGHEIGKIWKLRLEKSRG